MIKKNVRIFYYTYYTLGTIEFFIFFTLSTDDTAINYYYILLLRTVNAHLPCSFLYIFIQAQIIIIKLLNKLIKNRFRVFNRLKQYLCIYALRAAGACFVSYFMYLPTYP